MRSDAVIIKGIGGFYYTETPDGEIYECRAKGIFRKMGITPLAGDTGKSSGAHLHFEIRYGEINIDPETIVDFPNWELKPGS